MDLPMVELIKLVKLGFVMHKADHAYSSRSILWLYQLTTDLPFKACVINLPCTFTQYLDLSNF